MPKTVSIIKNIYPEINFKNNLINNSITFSIYK